MMIRLSWLLVLVMLCGPAGATPDLVSVVYHDVRDDVTADLDADQLATSTANLVSHFAWLRAHRYRPVSFEQVRAAWRDEQPLPAKAVLLTFDGSYRSFYERVLPLLRVFEFPAVLTITGERVEPSRSINVRGRLVNPDRFLNWRQIDEAVRSGWVEIASGGYANPDYEIAAVRTVDARPTVGQLFSTIERHVDPVEVVAGVRENLQKNSTLIDAKLGVRPSVVTWPSGRFSGAAMKWANRLGLDAGLTLAPFVPALAGHRMIGRVPIVANESLEGFKSIVESTRRTPPRRLLGIGLSVETQDSALPVDDADLSRRLARAVDVTGVNGLILNVGVDEKATAQWFEALSSPVQIHRLRALTGAARGAGATEVMLQLAPISTSRSGTAHFEGSGDSATPDAVPVNEVLNSLRLLFAAADFDALLLREHSPVKAETPGTVIATAALLDAFREFHPHARVVLQMSCMNARSATVDSDGSSMSAVFTLFAVHVRHTEGCATELARHLATHENHQRDRNAFVFMFEAPSPPTPVETLVGRMQAVADHGSVGLAYQLGQLVDYERDFEQLERVLSLRKIPRKY